MDILSICAGLVSGAVLALLAVRLVYRAGYVSRSVHDELVQLHQAARTALQVSEEKLNLQTQAVAALREEAGAREKALSDWTVRTSSVETSLAENQKRLQEYAGKLAQEERTNEAQQLELRKQHGEMAHLRAQHDALLARLADQRKDLEALQQQTRHEFENLAQKIFTEKTEKFSQLSKANLEAVIKPLSENIEGFRKKVEETYDKESRERFTLEARVKDLIESSARISQEANNLAAALKGQSKTQGDWGETILESILEQSGLAKNREYFLQASLRTEDGQMLRPDVLIKLPDNRHIIIDSKVSLNAYLRFTEAENREARELATTQHIQAIRAHVDQLSGKKYETLTDTLDFVMMFVPVEPAYLLAIQSDSDLWGYAYKRRILLISPTNLIAVMKIVADLWKREQQNRNALEIARQGEKLYDKFIGFVESLEEVGKHIDKSHDAYAKAMKQLKDGRGNLADQARKLRALGIKSAKPVPDSLRSADDEDSETAGPAEIQ